MNQLDFPRPRKYNPDWGLIILTGVVALLVVIFAGILITQVSSAFEGDPSPTPLPSKTPFPEPPAAYALQVQHRGTWVMRVTISAPGMETRVYESSGEGVDVTLPYYQAGPNENVAVEGQFIIYVTYPVFDGTGETNTGTREYGSHKDYVDAMNSNHYMLYDEQHQYLFIRDETELMTRYQELPRTVWQP